MSATIIDVEVVVTSPGRNFVSLLVTTSDGLVGIGDATLNGRELAVVSYLADHVAQQRRIGLIGRVGRGGFGQGAAGAQQQRGRGGAQIKFRSHSGSNP